MDNIVIIREAAATGGSILVGERADCDMTRPEFLEACRLAGHQISNVQLVDDKAKVSRIWVR